MLPVQPCCCFKCDDCLGGKKLPDQFTVTLSEIYPSGGANSCAACDDFNGTFVLTKTQTCKYQYTFPVKCGRPYQWSLSLVFARPFGSGADQYATLYLDSFSPSAGFFQWQFQSPAPYPSRLDCANWVNMTTAVRPNGTLNAQGCATIYEAGPHATVTSG